MKYKETLKVEKEEIKKWNFLLSKDIDEMTEEEKNFYNPKEYDFIGGYIVEFEDESYITFDLCSGGTNYYDEVIWHNKENTTEIVFDCAYTFATEKEECIVNDNSYIVEFQIEE